MVTSPIHCCMVSVAAPMSPTIASRRIVRRHDDRLASDAEMEATESVIGETSGANETRDCNSQQATRCECRPKPVLRTWTLLLSSILPFGDVRRRFPATAPIVKVQGGSRLGQGVNVFQSIPHHGAFSLGPLGTNSRNLDSAHTAFRAFGRDDPRGGRVEPPNPDRHHRTG